MKTWWQPTVIVPIIAAIILAIATVIVPFIHSSLSKTTPQTQGKIEQSTLYKNSPATDVIQQRIISRELTQKIALIQEELEHGRLREALQTVNDIANERPGYVAASDLKKDIEQPVRAEFAIKLRGDRSGSITSDAQTALHQLDGNESGFRVSAQLSETLYLYLYSEDRHGKIEQLFPSMELYDNKAVLQAHQTYWFPPQDAYHSPKWYPLSKEEHVIRKIYLVASRWPARELEKWGSALEGANQEEATRQLIQAVNARKKDDVGGCDVRIVQFQSSWREP